MNILQEIKKDHQEVKELFKKLQSIKSQKEREKEFLELKKELIPHMKAEEEIFYPALMNGDSKEPVLEGFEEHHASEMVLKDLDKTAVTHERWPAKLKVLSEMIEHHIKEEESEIFKMARSEMDKEKLEELAEKFDSKKQNVRKLLK